jgi:hypothetical protein
MSAVLLSTSCTNDRDRCQRSMFLARDQHEKANLIICPLPNCNHRWCKKCQQSVDFGVSIHSCDGTAELERLMKENGWKYCPSEFASAHCPSFTVNISFSFIRVQDTDPENIGM